MSTGQARPRETSRWRDLRYRLEQRLFHAGMWPVHRFSHENAGRLGERFSRLVFHAIPRSQRISRDNLRRIFPERDERELRQIALDSYACFGRAFLEEVSFRRFSKAELLERFEVVGREHLERALDMKRGLILLTGHFGAFDLSAFPITQEVGTCHLLIRPPSNPYLREEFEQVRKHLDAELVPRSRAGHRLYSLLRKGECIGIALDQRVRPWDGMLIDFLGHPAWTSPVPAFLAWKSRAPVLPVFCTPEPGGRYRLDIREPIVVEDEHYDPADITRRLSAELEHEIRARPDLWFWPHDRWKRIVRHRHPTALRRIRREADLELLGDDGRPAGGFDHGALASGRFLESVEHVVVRGERAEAEAWARGLARTLVERGFALRAADVTDQLATLRTLATDAERRRHLHGLDPVALLILTRVDEVRDPEDLRLLVELLEHRRHRGSVALLTETPSPAAGERDELPRALWDFVERARTHSLERP